MSFLKHRDKAERGQSHPAHKLILYIYLPHGSAEAKELTYNGRDVFFGGKLIGSYFCEADGISMTVSVKAPECRNEIYAVGGFGSSERAVFNVANITYNNKKRPYSLICPSYYELWHNKKAFTEGNSEKLLATYDECPAGALAALICAQASIDDGSEFHKYFCLL